MNDRIKKSFITKRKKDAVTQNLQKMKEQISDLSAY
jgi:hypothetical protein